MEDTSKNQTPNPVQPASSGNPEPAQPAPVTTEEETKPTSTPEPAAAPAPAAPAAPVQSPHSTEERILSALCYVPFLTILTSPLAVIKKPGSKFCEFHASQGILLFVVWFVSLFLAAALAPMIGGLIWLLLLVASAVGVVKAWSGSEFRIPGLAPFAKYVPVSKFFGAVKVQAGMGASKNNQPPTGTQNPPAPQA